MFCLFSAFVVVLGVVFLQGLLLLLLLPLVVVWETWTDVIY
jgi:hypothetical protein